MVTSNVESIIEKLEKKRKETGLSKNDFAIKELGVSPPTYKNWIRGKVKPNPEILDNIADYLKFEKEIKRQRK